MISLIRVQIKRPPIILATNAGPVEREKAKKKKMMNINYLLTSFQQAQRVFAKMPDYEGGYKQIVITKGADTFPLPDNFTHEEGAVSYYPFVTAHKALVHR